MDVLIGREIVSIVGDLRINKLTF